MRMLALAMLLSFTEIAHADTIYTYAGNPFNSCTSGCTTSGFLSGSITLAAAVPNSSSLADLSSQLISATFNDNGGLGVTISTSQLGSSVPVLKLGTDASGNLNAWFISISFSLPPGTTLFQNIQTESQNCCSGNPAHDYVYSGDGSVPGSSIVITVDGSAGAWTCTSGCPAPPSPDAAPVPEPSTWLLLMVGLPLMLCPILGSSKAIPPMKIRKLLGWASKASQ